MFRHNRAILLFLAIALSSTTLQAAPWHRAYVAHRDYLRASFKFQHAQNPFPPEVYRAKWRCLLKQEKYLRDAYRSGAMGPCCQTTFSQQTFVPAGMGQLGRIVYSYEAAAPGTVRGGQPVVRDSNQRAIQRGQRRSPNRPPMAVVTGERIVGSSTKVLAEQPTPAPVAGSRIHAHEIQAEPLPELVLTPASDEESRIVPASAVEGPQPTPADEPQPTPAEPPAE